ncbi:sensor histidine kinase [Paenibacillus sp. FA6]|uniref:sensor histidine kinase n=1 Tax=Paenibacillus sp. FA6 TaxID=3413029 RepID=UPI003F656379
MSITLSSSLSVIRYSIIILSAFISMYIYPYDNYGKFTLVMLLFLSLTVLERSLHNLSAKRLILCVEVIFSAWLCTTYGHLMLFVSLSTLLSYAFLPAVSLLRLMAFGIHLVLLNLAFQHEQPLWIICTNLIFLLLSILLSLLRHATGDRKEIIHLYDELRKKHYELDETRKRLVEFNHQVEVAAQSSERQRIARQLHDDIGHRLIRVKMMMEAAIQIMPTDAPRGYDMMLQIRDQVSDSMDNMRNTVKRMHPITSLKDEYAIDRLLENIGRETGIHTSLTIEGTPFPLYPSIQIVLYKNAQEALTNALRHGQATSIEVLLDYQDNEIRMSVSNNGIVGEPPAQGKRQLGMGMSGMQERIQLVGGSVDIRWAYPFTVVTRLPVYKSSEII